MSPGTAALLQLEAGRQGHFLEDTGGDPAAAAAASPPRCCEEKKYSLSIVPLLAPSHFTITIIISAPSVLLSRNDSVVGTASP